MKARRIAWEDDGQGGLVAHVPLDGRQFVLRCDYFDSVLAWMPRLYLDRGRGEEGGEFPLVVPPYASDREPMLEVAKARAVGMLDAATQMLSSDAHVTLGALARRMRGKLAADPNFTSPLFLEMTTCVQIVDALELMGL